MHSGRRCQYRACHCGVAPVGSLLRLAMHLHCARQSRRGTAVEGLRVGASEGGGGTAAAEPGLRALRMHASGRQYEARPVGVALAALSGVGWSCRVLTARGRSVLGIATVVLRCFSRELRQVRAAVAAARHEEHAEPGVARFQSGCPRALRFGWIWSLIQRSCVRLALRLALRLFSPATTSESNLRASADARMQHTPTLSQIQF